MQPYVLRTIIYDADDAVGTDLKVDLTEQIIEIKLNIIIQVTP